ncbi:unnamed protein product [Gongylonema pulchrum]|uniref:HMA domain-containing protein n=1 Tax=Gongylonema pulchrum TaxID=637853 RepID=A0A183EYP2_9BILA|nr:unnamed protein product [Gongylonema pulchrum]
MAEEDSVEKLLTFLSPPAAAAPTSNERKVAVIDVQGMTCHSCVNNILENLRSHAGIHRAGVSLKQKEAVVEFDVNLNSGESIATIIDSMGFDAKLKYIKSESFFWLLKFIFIFSFKLKIYHFSVATG